MAAKEAAPGSVEQKIADLYRMGLDSTRLNAEGAAPIEGAVGEILAIADRGQLAPAIATLHRSVGNPFFAVGVEADLMDSDTNALYIAQDGLGMGDRDYYLEASNEHIRTAYKNYLATIFRLAGLPEAEIERAVASVMRIETQLAEKAWSNVELRDIPAMYNPMTKAEFEQTYDGIDWEAYFRTIGIGDFDRIIVSTPSSVANAVELLRDAPLEELRYYLAAQYINAAASYLSDDFQEASFDFFGRTMAGQQEMKPRWKRAMSVPNGTLAEAVGKLYVAEYFPEKDKERMLVLVDNLRKALAQHIDALDWMSDETKARAQEKLDSFTVKIGYPDTWKGLHDARDRPLEELLGEHPQRERMVYGRQSGPAGQTRRPGEVAHVAADGQRLLQPHDQRDLLPGRHSPAAVLQPRCRRRGQLRRHRRGDRPRDDPRIRRSGPPVRQGGQHEQLVDGGRR